MSHRNFQDGTEIVFGDLNGISQAIFRTMFDRIIYEIGSRTDNAFFGNSFLCSYLSPTSLNVAAGSGFILDSTALSPSPGKKHLYLPTNQTVNLSAAHPSQDRIDLVCVTWGTTNEITETRNYKDATSGAVSSISAVTQIDSLAQFQVVAGTPGVSPVAPAVPSGYIAIAQCYVSAAAGMSGSGAVTDKRTLIPLGSNTLINTLGYNRLPANANSTLASLMAAIDAFLKNGYFNYLDVDVLSVDPANPAANTVRMYQKSGVFYFKDSSGTITPIGSGGGGGGGANWYGAPGVAPVEDTEFGEKVWMFDATNRGVTVQKLELWVKVPTSFIGGRQIKMNIGHYSPSTSGTILLSAQTTLIRKNNDAMSSVALQQTSSNTALTNTVANQYREANVTLTDATGKIGGVAVSAGDLIKVELFRGSDTDTADIRFVPSATEITFS